MHQAVGLAGGPADAGVAPEIAAMLARTEDNMTFWMEHEFRQYPAYHPDLGALGAVAEKIVPTGGRDSREKGTCRSCPLSRSPGDSPACPRRWSSRMVPPPSELPHSSPALGDRVAQLGA